MDISFKTARELNKLLGGSSISTVGIGTQRELSSSSSKKSRRRGGSFDSSLLSLMSMSISEITPGSPSRTREGSSGTPDEVKVKNTNEVWNSMRCSDLIVDEVEEDHLF